MLTVRTQVKEILSELGMRNMSVEYMDKLDEKVRQIIIDSVNRAKENSRRTVMGKDI